jgi:hypothetical protein
MVLGFWKGLSAFEGDAEQMGGKASQLRSYPKKAGKTLLD